MQVLDATFLIDYLGGVPAAAAFYDANHGLDGFWIMPAPAHAGALVGVGNQPDGDVERVVEAPVVSADGDLTHLEAQRVIAVEAY